MAVDRKIWILIADEAPEARRILRETLEELYFEHIEEAADGEDAWDQLTQGHFGLVLCEWLLPRRSGLDLLEAMQADENLRSTPLVLVTTESDAETVQKAVAEGAAGFVVKPFDHFTLGEQLEEAFIRQANLFPFQ
ncbi:MAG: response regulator [bacterium]|nr:response regulator [bacterium]